MDQVDEVKQKTDIVSVIGSRVDLKKAGRNFKGVCPFHNEKTPSFMVSPELQIYKCFCCGETGDVISFVQKFEGLEFWEALEVLAEKAGVKLERSFQGDSKKKLCIDLNSEAAKLYHYILKTQKVAEVARRYLKQRGISDQIINDFRLGFAPEKPDILSRYLQKKGYHKTDLEMAGLVYQTQRGLVDRFRGRVIFPIFDLRGVVIALGGRILPSNQNKNIGKYINSPETPSYHKSRSFYGFDKAKAEIKNKGFLLLLEGEMDFLAAWRSGIKNAAAIKGTALTSEHLSVISRFTKKVVLAFDNDFAGKKSATSAIAEAQKQGILVKVVNLKKFKDPDEFVASDKDGFVKAVLGAQDAWDFLIDKAFEQFNDKGSQKAEISRQITPVLASIPDEIVKSHYTRLVAERLGVEPDSVLHEINRAKPWIKYPDKEEGLVDRNSQLDEGRLGLEKELFGLLVKNNPNELLEKQYQEIFKSSLGRKLYKSFKKYMNVHTTFSPSEFNNTLASELKQAFGQVFLQEFDAQHLNRYILRLKNRILISEIEHEIEKQTQRLKSSDSQKDQKILAQLIQKKAALQANT